MSHFARGLLVKTVLLFMTSLSLSSAAQAQSYPAKPVRFIVPFGPGGGSDTMARLLGEALQQALGQPFVVENRPGAGGFGALQFVGRSAPDGYNIVITPNSMTYSSAFYQSTFDPVKDVSPVIMVSEAPIVIGGHPDRPVKNLGEFIAYAKANPGKLSYASCGGAGLQVLAMEALKKAANIDVLQIPYNGCGPPIPDMLSGRVPFYASVMNSVSAFLQKGQLQVYGISNASRSALLPNVPTIAESGFPGFAINNWIGVFTSVGASNEVVAKLNSEFNKALSRPDIREKMTALFIEPVGGTPQKLGDAVKSDGTRYAQLLKELCIAPPQ